MHDRLSSVKGKNIILPTKAMLQFHDSLSFVRGCVMLEICWFRILFQKGTLCFTPDFVLWHHL